MSYWTKWDEAYAYSVFAMCGLGSAVGFAGLIWLMVQAAK